MAKNTKTVPINYSVGNCEKADTVGFTITGTGIDTNNPEHIVFMGLMVEELSRKMYEKVHKAKLGTMNFNSTDKRN